MGNIVLTLTDNVPQETFSGTSVAHTSAGVTYNFPNPVTYGYYLNGEPFVVSGGSDVTISSITPAGTSIRNGTVVQPTLSTREEFDSRASSYDGADNVDPGKTGSNLVIPAATWPSGCSVVKAVSRDTTDGDGGGTRSYISRYSALTIVPTVPPEGAFRPPVYGTDKTSYFTESDINYTKLQSLALTSGQAEVGDFTYFHGGVMDSWQASTSVSRDVRPVAYADDYSPDNKGRLTGVLVALHSNVSNTAKKDLFVFMLQAGIDYCGAVLNGRVDHLGSTHGDEYMLPMVVAATVFDNSTLKSAVTTPGAGREREDILLVASGDLNSDYFQTSVIADPPGTGAFYDPVHVGYPEWFNEPAWKNPLVTARYRAIYDQHAPQAALAMEMLGDGAGRTVFAHEPVFLYAARVQEWYNNGYDGDGANSQATWANTWVEAYGPTYSDDIAVTAQPPEAPYDFTILPSSTSATVTIDGPALIGTGTLTQIDLRWSTDLTSWKMVTDFTNGGTVTGLPSSSLIYVQCRYVTSVATGPWSTNQITTSHKNLETELGLDWKSTAYRDKARKIYEGVSGVELFTVAHCQGVTFTAI